METKGTYETEQPKSQMPYPVQYGNPAQVQSVLTDMQKLLENMERFRPQERSEISRRWAITITEMEKVSAYFNTYVRQEGKLDV